jgi:CDP-diglyceride synthetase
MDRGSLNDAITSWPIAVAILVGIVALITIAIQLVFGMPEKFRNAVLKALGVSIAGLSFLALPSALRVVVLIAFASRAGWEFGSLTQSRPYIWCFAGALATAAAVFLPTLIVLLGAVSLGVGGLFLPRSFTLAVVLAATTIVFIAGILNPTMIWILFAVIVIAEVFDSLSFVAGSAIGKHRLAPRISPGKTVEGALAGWAGTLLFGIGAAVLSDVVSVPMAIIVVSICCAVALVGDLSFSILKRRFGKKDFPTLVPVQGGLLDVTDSWIVTGAVSTVLLSVLT